MREQDEKVVYVVDDDSEVRSSIMCLMNEVSVSVETFTTADEFLDSYDQDLRGLLILDVRLPRMSGLQLLRLLHERGSVLPVIMLTGHGDVPMAVEAMHYGAIDFIEKPYRPQHLLDRVLSGLARGSVLRRRRARLDDAEQRWNRLTPEEKDIALLFTEGLANKEIAARLGVTSQAIDARRHRILDKLEVATVAELIKLIIFAENALVEAGAEPDIVVSNLTVGSSN